jgi:hypothetical protein
MGQFRDVQHGYSSLNGKNISFFNISSRGEESRSNPAAVPGRQMQRDATNFGARRIRGENGQTSRVRGPLLSAGFHGKDWFSSGAGEEIRTLDPNLGKVVLYP